MVEQSQLDKLIPGRTLEVNPSKLFMYPTRIFDAWQAERVEINLPSYQLTRPDVVLSVHQDSTGTLDIPLKIDAKLYRAFHHPIKIHEGLVYDARYDVDGNMSHILVNVAALALEAKDLSPEITIVLSEKATKMALESYEILGFTTLCTNKDVYGNLVFVSNEGQKNCHQKLYLSGFDNWNFEEDDKLSPQRVFIARKDSRKIINETEIEQLLKEYGFEKFYFEDLPIRQQWLLMQKAKVVVSVHGAALGSLVFNRQKVKLIELFHPGYVVKMYREMANGIDGVWCGVIGQLTGEVITKLDFEQKSRYFASSPMLIDQETLHSALAYLEVTKI